MQSAARQMWISSMMSSRTLSTVLNSCLKILALRSSHTRQWTRIETVSKSRCRFLGSSSCSKPPLLSTSESMSGDREVGLRPCPEILPNLLCKSAVHKEVGAVLTFGLAQSTQGVVWPSSALEIICRKAPIVHSKPHKKSALHRGLRLPNRFGTCKASASDEEQLISGTHRECSFRCAAPNRLVRLASVERYLTDQVPKMEVLG